MNRWLQITSGQGPAECQWVLARVVELIESEATDAGIVCHLLETAPGEEKETLKSALLALDGDGAEQFAGAWQGTIQWIGRSPYRPEHKRKNWFVGVELFAPPEKPAWSESDLRIDAMRSSAVRVTHLPTGLVVVAREERSQHQNRRLALARLAQLLENRNTDAEDASRQQRWEQHGELERGNPVRVYEGAAFRRRKSRQPDG